MIPRCMRTGLTVLLMIAATVAGLRAQTPPAPQGEPPPPEAAPGAPPGEGAPAPEGQAADVTPPRLSFTHGEVSFWRPGADDWTPAQLNTPLAPGDAVYAGAGATLELQIGTRAFVRAGENTQLGLANQEPGFLQLKVPAGHASLDLRSLETGQTVELDTPNAAYTIEASGYYRVDITDDTTTFITRRGGHATMTPAGGEAVSIAPSEEVVAQGSDTAIIGTYAAPDLDAWDRWNYQRTDHLIDAVSARYVSPDVYGIDALDHYGTWRVTPDYGPVWLPEVADGWAPYSAGRWVWDPYYGWTWIDDAPWGWAPCHYGRWVHAGRFWAWAPGPLIAAPAYAPALVAFFGGPHFGVSVGIGAPAVGWVALGWGEPLVPWWGRPGFIGVPSWHGWGGPHVVNNVVIERTTVVDVKNITVYQNVNVRNAVIAVREDHFGRGVAEHIRVPEIDPHQLEPVYGRLPVQPVAASLTPRSGHAVGPPEAIAARSVVATRAPHDTSAVLRAQGLSVANRPAPAPRIVSSPHAPQAPFAASRAPFGQQSTTERPPPAPPLGYEPPRSSQQRQPEPSAAPPAPRNLPGEPANRLYRQAPERHAPQSTGRAVPQRRRGR